MCKISVIVPVYNAEDYLEDTLKSICDQSLKDIEIICIDDGSKDSSKDIVHNAQKNDYRIRYAYQENQGAGMARNRGIALSKGDYIAFMDADDCYPSRNVLEKLYDAAIKNNAIVCGGSAKISNRERDKNDKRKFDVEGYIKFSEYQFDFLFVRFIFKRTFIQENQILFPKLRVYEDPVFLANALYKAKQFYAIPDDVYLYSGVHHCDVMSSKKVEDFLQGVIEELKYTSQNDLKELHRLVWKRLENEASYYAEQYIYQENKTIYRLLLEANEAVDRNLLAINSDYILPVLISIFNAGNKYMKIRNNRGVKIILNLLKR